MKRKAIYVPGHHTVIVSYDTMGHKAIDMGVTKTPFSKVESDVPDSCCSDPYFLVFDEMLANIICSFLSISYDDDGVGYVRNAMDSQWDEAKTLANKYVFPNAVEELIFNEGSLLFRHRSFVRRDLIDRFNEMDADMLGEHDIDHIKFVLPNEMVDQIDRLYRNNDYSSIGEIMFEHELIDDFVDSLCDKFGQARVYGNHFNYYDGACEIHGDWYIIRTD